MKSAANKGHQIGMALQNHVPTRSNSQFDLTDDSKSMSAQGKQEEEFRDSTILFTTHAKDEKKVKQMSPGITANESGIEPPALVVGAKPRPAPAADMAVNAPAPASPTTLQMTYDPNASATSRLPTAAPPAKEAKSEPAKPVDMPPADGQPSGELG